MTASAPRYVALLVVLGLLGCTEVGPTQITVRNDSGQPVRILIRFPDGSTAEQARLAAGETRLLPLAADDGHCIREPLLAVAADGRRTAPREHTCNDDVWDIRAQDLLARSA